MSNTGRNRRQLSAAQWAKRPGQGLDWDKIRKEYAEKASPEELANSPFDENGNLKSSKTKQFNTEAAEQQEKANRKSRAKDKPMTRAQAGAMASKKRGAGVLLPQVEKDAMAQLYREGLPIRVIAARVARSQETVRKVLVGMNLHTPGERNRKAGSSE